MIKVAGCGVGLLVLACVCPVLAVVSTAMSALSFLVDPFGWFMDASSEDSNGEGGSHSVTCIVTGEEAITAIANMNLGYDEVQWGHAATIYQAGADMGLPERAMVIAVATAMQESTLHNLANTNVSGSMTLPGDGVPGFDEDSVGLFQQRPSMGWGTVEELMTPYQSAQKFYDKLLTVDGWETMPLTVAAQEVQVSAHPNAYAKHESNATTMVETIRDHGGCGAAAFTGDVSALGWTHPLPGAVAGSGFRTPGRPTHDGVDIMEDRGVPIFAAASGTVLQSTCNASDPNGNAYSCNVDGSPSIGGCGWYVDLEHDGGYITRYCHMVTQPLVSVGDTVEVGDTLGYVGTSGNSSGPHLHFEVHINSDQSSSGAINPIPHMQKAGAPIT